MPGRKLSNPRSIPSVERVLQQLRPVGLPRPVVVALVRRELARHRLAGRAPESATLLAALNAALTALVRSRIQPVINGTGVLIHTNLGRAPLSPNAIAALTTVASQYSNLEFNLDSGERGERAGYLERALALLCGAEAATVVNNCAAALVLVLRHLTAQERREVVISRGELVQIGGGFRIPEILETSGARLREVGTTNQTTLEDYARAMGRDTALVLRVHRSNFYMGGFVDSPATSALAALARKHRLPLIEDLGSGAVVDTRAFGLDPEPTPAEVLRQGVSLVCFSGDKLLGGPQAGIIAGQQRLVRALKRHPFFRPLRADKLVLGALQSTVDDYLNASASHEAGDAARRFPLLAMASSSPEALRSRADAILAGIGSAPFPVAIGSGQSQVGGGTLPRANLESVTIDLVPPKPQLAQVVAQLRRCSPPVIAYVSASRVKIDLRTVFPEQDPLLIQALHETIQSSSPP